MSSFSVTITCTHQKFIIFGPGSIHFLVGYYNRPPTQDRRVNNYIICYIILGIQLFSTNEITVNGMCVPGPGVRDTKCSQRARLGNSRMMRNIIIKLMLRRNCQIEIRLYFATVTRNMNLNSHAPSTCATTSPHLPQHENAHSFVRCRV